jgi:hypothetical protein
MIPSGDPVTHTRFAPSIMVNQETVVPAKPKRSPAKRAIDVLSGYGVATITLLLLGILTWFATLEQVETGLHPVLKKYFSPSWATLIIFPELQNLKINDKLVPIPLPGGYFLCALLLVNLTLGGIIRIRKGWRKAGVLIAHFGIIFMLVAGAVAHHFSERGNMPVWEGTTSNVAEDYFEYVVEIAEIIDDVPHHIHVIRGEYLTDLEDGKTRTFRLPDFPFNLELTHYLEHAVPISAMERAPALQEHVVDGYYLFERPREEAAERHTAGCYGRVLNKEGAPSEQFIVAGASFAPFTYRHDDRVFTIDMRKRLWPMPFSVRLDKFTAEFHPGTSQPAKFASEITRIEKSDSTPVLIEMNEPMRYQGLTFFQASYGPEGAGPDQELFSVFEVVQNPADKWPEYSLYVVAFGLLVHFIIKLAAFLNRGASKSRNAT